jgi:lipopolysaccharide transport system permease protein
MSTAGGVSPVPGELLIEAGRSRANYWRDLWRFRELLAILVWRDVVVRYKQTVLGLAWALIRPILTTAILVFAFHKIAQLPSVGVPYPILVLVANIPWVFFAAALGESSHSLIANSNLVSKVYFPRMVLPLTAVVVALVDCLICLALLPLVMAWYGYWPDWRAVFAPVFIAMAFAAALGPGLLVAALNVKYRDFRYVVPFVAQLGLYLSPVGFATSVVEEKFGSFWLLVYSLNPMVGVIDGMRWALCPTAPFNAASFMVSATACAALLGLGAWYFRRTERGFADVI